MVAEVPTQTLVVELGSHYKVEAETSHGKTDILRMSTSLVKVD